MLNSCVLTGNLGADPEVFYSSEGEPDESAGGKMAAQMAMENPECILCGACVDAFRQGTITYDWDKVRINNGGRP